jgi:hypothetical protein
MLRACPPVGRNGCWAVPRTQTVAAVRPSAPCDGSAGQASRWRAERKCPQLVHAAPAAARQAASPPGGACAAGGRLTTSLEIPAPGVGSGNGLFRSGDSPACRPVGRGEGAEGGGKPWAGLARWLGPAGWAGGVTARRRHRAGGAAATPRASRGQDRPAAEAVEAEHQIGDGGAMLMPGIGAGGVLRWGVRKACSRLLFGGILFGAMLVPHPGARGAR